MSEDGTSLDVACVANGWNCLEDRLADLLVDDNVAFVLDDALGVVALLNGGFDHEMSLSNWVLDKHYGRCSAEVGMY